MVKLPLVLGSSLGYFPVQVNITNGVVNHRAYTVCLVLR